MHIAKLKKLLRDINDKDASRRRAAAEALSGGDERAIYPLIKALKDDNFGVQDAAMRSLMEIKGETTAYMVLPLLRENSFLRNTAIMIIREMDKIAVPLLYVLLNDRDDDIRKFALDLIHDIQYCSYPEKLVEMLTGDQNANVRAAAAKTIGMLQYKKAIPQLIKALSDEEWVCFSALEALTNLKDDASTDALIGLLNNSSETIRFAAIEALGKIGASKAIQHLSQHISDSEGFEKTATIKSLARMGCVPSLPGVAAALIDILKEDEWDDKLIAINGLVSLKAEDAIYHVIDLAGSLDLSEPDSDDKLSTIKEAVHNFGCNDSLIALLNDDSIKYRGKVVVIEIVGDLRCKKSVPALINLLKSDFRDVRRTSIKSLGEIDSEEAKECLMEAISDDDSHVRKTAVAALGKIREMTAFEPLMKMLQNEQYNDVIDEFINALMNINPTLFLSRVGELNENIRKIAARYSSELNSEITC
ncbi:MAG: HEAT repeat domain-containing protein [Nitrospirae bacterium]|nr:HEAT repeat domain-containing protein [Nitrospirota bacterium]